MYWLDDSVREQLAPLTTNEWTQLAPVGRFSLMTRKVIDRFRTHPEFDRIRDQMMETLMEETLPSADRYDPREFGRVYIIDTRKEQSPIYLAALIDVIKPYSPMPVELRASDLPSLKKNREQYDELGVFDFIKQQADPLLISGFDFDADSYPFNLVMELFGARLFKPKVNILLTTNPGVLGKWPAATDMMRKDLFWPLPNNIKVPNTDFSLE